MLHAVVVGVDAYQDPSIPNLRFAVRDARALAVLCQESSHASEISVHLLTDEDATRERVLHLIGTDLAREVNSQDLVLIYFAGHGSPETARGVITAERFLACYDTFRERLFATAIDVNADLMRAVARLRGKLVVVILDACFSGYSGGRGFVGPDFEAYRRERRAGLRLGDLEFGSGTAYMAAATDSEVAWEDERLGHGIFSYYILEQLRASNESPMVGLATLYDRVYAEVRLFSRNRQHPVLWGSVTGASLPILNQGQELYGQGIAFYRVSACGEEHSRARRCSRGGEWVLHWFLHGRGHLGRKEDRILHHND
jgi:uncharacterized caspase-like protein